VIDACNTSINRLAKVNLTEAQRSDAISYSAGQVIQFDRRAKGGFKAGEQWEILTENPNLDFLVKLNSFTAVTSVIIPRSPSVLGRVNQLQQRIRQPLTESLHQMVATLMFAAFFHFFEAVSAARPVLPLLCIPVRATA
jgi:hypothetical protein